MPKLSDTMTVGVLNEWRKKEGDPVAPGDILAEVETDKANMELENYESGVLLKIVIPKGGKVPVGGVIAIVGQKGENIEALLKEVALAQAQVAPQAPAAKPAAKPAAPTPAAPAAKAPPPAPAPAAAPSAIPPEERAGRVKASPLARKIAKERGVDLMLVVGSGPGGRIIKKDIESLLTQLAAGTPPAAQEELPPLVAKDIALSQMRQTIARRLLESKSAIPHFYVTVAVDMSRAVALRESLKASGAGPVSYNDMIIRACALALRRFPEVNASFMGEFIRLYDHIHIGMAVAIPDGLITPIIRDADLKSLQQISGETRELALRAKERKLKPDEYTGSTFTTSNMGMFDVEEFTAIINPPEAAILAIGAIEKKPVVREGAIVVGAQMRLTLSCDHRAVDGATAARFLKEVRRLLENPVLLIL